MVALTRSAAITGYDRLARAVGLDPVRMVRTFGIPRAALINPDLKISGTAVGRLLERSAEHSGVEDFGLRLASDRKLSNLGAVGLVLREQPTLRKAIEVLVQWSWLHNESVGLRLEETADVAILHPVLGHDESPRQSVEATMAILVRGLRALLGDSWRPELVCFRHAPPKSQKLHRRIFDCELAFNQDIHGVVLARRDLDLPIPDADPAMAREVARYVEQFGRSPKLALSGQIRELVFATLPLGRCTADVIAQRLGLDRRTLYRRLSAERTTFHEIVEDARAQLVRRYFSDGNRALASVAELLGFSSPSAFSRWHRMRFGQPPSSRNRPRARRR